MKKLARTRTGDISTRVLATLSVVLGFAVVSGDAEAGLGGGILVGTDCANLVTKGLAPAAPPLMGLTGNLTSAPCATGSGDVSSFVDYGVMKTIGHATGSGALGFGQSSTHILFSDLFTFDPVNSSLIGQSATVQARIQLQALLTGGAEWTLDVTLGATTDSFFGQNNNPDTFDCSSPCTFDLTLGMTLGTPTLLQVDLQAIDVVFAQGFSSFDLSHSVYWDGIQNVTVNGEPVVFTLESTSGHDWTQSSVPTSNGSAPESGSLALVALGLAGLGFARCRVRVN